VNAQRHSMDDNNIGLYMSKEIIQGHMHGTITVENFEETIDEDLRKGVKFEIMLPLQSRNAA
ncbi:MAG: hypothetical protein OEW60_07540, partial [Thiovulaceae bacterium]|nr:hypothetical protein [Sulfurimonadaceae bacterium]